VAVCQLFINFKKAHVSVQWEVLYNILIEFCIPMKLVRLIKMCLNQTYSRVWVGRHLSDKFSYLQLVSGTLGFMSNTGNVA